MKNLSRPRRPGTLYSTTYPYPKPELPWDPPINRPHTRKSLGTRYTARGRTHRLPPHRLLAPRTPEPRQASRPPGSAALPREPPPEPPPSGARLPRLLSVPAPRLLLGGDALQASLPGQRRRASGLGSPKEEKEATEKERPRPAAAATAPTSSRVSACVR